MNFPMDDNLLDEKWGQLVNSHFGDLQRDMTKMVTTKDMEGNDVVDEALCQELDWAISAKKFEDLLEGSRSHRVQRAWLHLFLYRTFPLFLARLASSQRMSLAYVR